MGEPVDGIPNIVLYRGPNYEARNKDLDEPVVIPGGLLITTTPDNDINFSILTAVSDQASVITVKNSAGERIIEVNTLGTVTEKYELPPTTK